MSVILAPLFNHIPRSLHGMAPSPPVCGRCAVTAHAKSSIESDRFNLKIKNFKALKNKNDDDDKKELPHL